MILLAIAAAVFVTSIVGLFIHFDRCNEEVRSARLGAGRSSSDRGEATTTVGAEMVRVLPAFLHGWREPPFPDFRGAMRPVSQHGRNRP